MQILGRFALLIVFCSVFEFYKEILQIVLGFLGMECAACIKFFNQGPDFGCGFVMFGGFSPVFNVLGLFLVFIFGLKVFQAGCHSKCLMEFLCEFRGKASELRAGFCSKCGFGQVYASNPLENINSEQNDDNVDDDDDDDDEDHVCYGEDEEFDVVALRKLVKMERRRAEESRADLEKERMACASAAEEAMAMILRLQNEKSCIEIQANQYRGMAEQKQRYDEAVIQSLQWIILKHEEICSQKLKRNGKIDEMVQSQEADADPSANVFNSTMEDDGMDGSFNIYKPDCRSYL